jgi:histidine triad (HIT) family protein
MLRLLFRLARTPLAGYLVGLAFTYCSFAIPARRLRETATLVAFHHPRPSYPVHILIVPKKRLADVAILGEADVDFMRDLFAVTGSLVKELGLGPAGYRLISNGGAYQDVKQLHFHLVAGESF